MHVAVRVVALDTNITIFPDGVPSAEFRWIVDRTAVLGDFQLTASSPYLTFEPATVTVAMDDFVSEPLIVTAFSNASIASPVYFTAEADAGNNNAFDFNITYIDVSLTGECLT